MPARPLPSENRPTLYRVEFDADRNPIIPIDAPPPTGAPIDAPPFFRIEHPLYEPSQRAEWLADELLAPGSVFHGKVHVPNDKAAKKKVRQAAGAAPITYATFKGVIDHMLRQAPRVEAVCLPEELIAEAILEGPNSLSHQKVEQGGVLLARLFLHYWRAVATAFPEAWDDMQEHILWHPHGLNALAKLGAQVVQDQVDSYDIRQHYFDEVLERIAGKVSLKKSEHTQVPSHETSDHLFGLLYSARHAAGRTAGLTAVPGTVGSIDWGSGTAPLSPSVTSIPAGYEE